MPKTKSLMKTGRLAVASSLAVAAASWVAIGADDGGSAAGAAGAGASPTPTTSPGATPTPGATSASGAQGTTREVYTVQLSPSNGSGVSGTATFAVDGNTVGAFVQAFGLAPGISHEMHLHAGVRCPTPGDDQNGDGFIDAPEAEALTSPPLVPLTLNPNPAQSGRTAASGVSRGYPVAATDGTLTYIQSANTNILPGGSGASGQEAGATPTPTSTTPSGTSGALDGLVLELHGINPNFTLPSTVRSDDGKPATTTLPVACGVLIRTIE